MAAQRSLREIALERTFSLYFTHFALWLTLLLPVIATGGVIFLAVRTAILGTLGPGTLPATVKAAMAGPWTAVLVWALAGIAGGQICALLVLDRRAHPGVNMVLLAVLRRAPRLLATASLFVVVVGLAGLAGLAMAAGLIYLPQLVLPPLGVSPGTARTLSLLITLPMLVAGAAPALWALARFGLSLPLSAIVETSPFAILGVVAAPEPRSRRDGGRAPDRDPARQRDPRPALPGGRVARDAAVLARAVPADLRRRSARRGRDRGRCLDPAGRDDLRQRR